MFQHILLPTDGSEPATEALDVAINVADRFDATLHVLSAVEFIPYPEFPDMATAKELEIKRAEQTVEDAQEKASDQGITIVTEVVRDEDSHEAINTYCDEHDIDLIVMGTHGRSGLERLLLGSTTERTLRMADIPVLAVPMDEE